MEERELFYNQTSSVTGAPLSDDKFILFKLSNMYYTLLGTTLVFLVGYVVSICTGGYDAQDERLFSPVVRKKKVDERELKEIMKTTGYLNIERANKVVEDGGR